MIDDLRIGLRMLRKGGTSTVVAVLALALAIGALCAIFSVADITLFNPFAFEDSDRLVSLGETTPQQSGSSVSYLNFRDWKAESTSFEELGAFRRQWLSLLGGEAPERVLGLATTPGLFSSLGIQAQLGRPIQGDDDRVEAEPVAVLSHGLWQRRFGGDPSVLGRTLDFAERDFTVIGVLPPDFVMPLSEDAELWVPLALWKDDPMLLDRGNRPGIEVIGRLKTSVSRRASQQEMDRIAERLAAQHPSSNAGWGVRVEPLKERVFGSLGASLLALLVAGGLALLAAYANVGSILLARAVHRDQEMAMRAALGASRRRLARQFLAESFLLNGSSAIFGLLIAVLGIEALRPILVDFVPGTIRLGLNLRILGLCLAVVVAGGLALGMLPLWRTLGRQKRDLWNPGLGRGTPGRRDRWGLRVLVATQVALVLLLIASASLVLRSSKRLDEKNPGLDASQVLTASMTLPGGNSLPRQERTLRFRALVERLESLPGLDGVSVIEPIPFSGSRNTVGFVLEGSPTSDRPEDRKQVEIFRLGGDAFETLGLQLVSGRPLTPLDREDAPAVALVDEVFAHRYWPDRSPLGQRIKLNYNPQAPVPWREVVGVVRQVRAPGDPSQPAPQLFVPFDQRPLGQAGLVLRSPQDPQLTLPMARKAVAELFPSQPLYRTYTLEEYLDSWTADRRLALLLLALASGVALSLALAGIYGLVAYTLRQQVPDIAVRLALGAKPEREGWRLVRETMIWVAGGLVAGCALTPFLRPLFSSLLFEAAPREATLLIPIAALLALAAFVASVIPARRASRIDPASELRKT